MHLFDFKGGLCTTTMVALRRVVRAKKAAKEVDLNDNVLNLSLTLGLKIANICKTKKSSIICFRITTWPVLLLLIGGDTEN